MAFAARTLGPDRRPGRHDPSRRHHPVIQRRNRRRHRPGIHDEHFAITVELVPQARTGLPYRDLPDWQHLTWWATDNLGGYYLGEQGSWDPRGGRCRGTILFWPAPDPSASSIDLMPTATTARAVIRVPLPRAGH